MTKWSNAIVGSIDQLSALGRGLQGVCCTDRRDMSWLTRRVAWKDVSYACPISQRVP